MGISHFAQIHPNELIAQAQNLDFHIRKVPLRLDLDDLQKRLRVAQVDFPWLSKDRYRQYRSLGLQFSDADHRFTDAIDASSKFEPAVNGEYPRDINIRPFHLYEKDNEAAELFAPIFSRVRPLRLFRSRLLTIQAGFEMKTPHVDGKMAVRLHIPIETDPEAWMEVDGERYHLPADGSGYLVNTSLYHRVGNSGKKDRTHFVAVLYSHFPYLMHLSAQNALIKFFLEPANGSKIVIDRKLQEAQIEAKGRCALCDQMTKMLYVAPLPSTQLKCLCPQCIENVARQAASQSASGALSETAFCDQLEKSLLTKSS